MHQVYRFGPFRLDTGVGSLTRDERPTGLGLRAVGLLQVLLARANRYVSKSELLDAAWPGLVVEEANLAVQISAIRKALGQDCATVRIETLPRRGYRLLGTVNVEAVEGRQVAATPLAGSPNNLPAERDSFVGRREELHSLARRWEDGARLITLIGAGGSGKTRLAHRYALNALDAWPGGVFFCDLSEARIQDGICFAVASALGVQLTGGDPVALLGHAVAGLGRCLLILDNFEQVSSLAAATLGRWLERAALASFLVTSRERLHMKGEALFPLEPLPLDTDAVELFRVRALAQRPEFGLDVDGADDVGRIVRLVDGLPLAIELAAARIRVLSVRQIAERMSDRFRVLVGTRGTTARQTTMKATIDWSWDLLTAWEQCALATCSVFEGGFTLRAAEAVLDLSQWAQAPPAIDVIESLIDKSLLRAFMPEVGGRRDLDEPHFGMYISLHEYAAEKLDLLGSRARRVAEERHGRYFAGFGSEHSLELLTGEEEIQRRRAHALALENLVAAFRRAARRGDVGTLVPAYRAAWEVLEVRGPIAIANELGSQLPELTSNSDGVLIAGHIDRARALWLAGQTHLAANLLETVIALTSQHDDRRHEGVARQQLGVILRGIGRGTEARTHSERALLLHREVGNRHGEARVLSNLGNIHLDQARHDEAKTLYLASLEVYRAIGDTDARATTLGNLAVLSVDAGDFDEARCLFGEALQIARRSGNRHNEGVLLGNMGYLADRSGRLEESLELAEAALLIHRQVGDRRFEGLALNNLAGLRLARGDLDEAMRQVKASLEVAVELGDRELEGNALAHLGRLHERQQRLDQARACLQSSVEILRSISSRRFEGVALGGLGSVLARLGLIDEARTAFASGAELLQQTNDPAELGKLLCGHARAELDAGHPDLAITLVGDAERLADNLRSNEGRALSGEIASLRERI